QRVQVQAVTRRPEPVRDTVPIDVGRSQKKGHLFDIGTAEVRRSDKVACVVDVHDTYRKEWRWRQASEPNHRPWFRCRSRKVQPPLQGAVKWHDVSDDPSQRIDRVWNEAQSPKVHFTWILPPVLVHIPPDEHLLVEGKPGPRSSDHLRVVDIREDPNEP